MFNKSVKLAVISVLSAAAGVQAGDLYDFATGDVLVCFRISGKNNLVVDVGPISTFTNAAPNQVIPITQYAGSQLASIGTNSLTWSAFAWFDDTVSPVSAQGTLFVTKARPSLNVKSVVWEAQSAAAQLGAGFAMSVIPPGAYVNRSFSGVNTQTAIVEPETGGANYPQGQSYVDAIYTTSLAPDFGTSLNGNPENTTGSHFITGGVAQRSDFWWSPPTDSGNAVKYLGYFELNPNGSMTYVAYPSSGAAPTVATTAASVVTNNSATLNGTVNPNGQTTTVYFEYGLTTSYGSTKPVAGTFAGSSVQAASTNLTGLNFATTYHFRLDAYNATGTNFGTDQTFTTAAIPQPRVTAFSRVGNSSLISFSTYTALTYTVRGTNQLSGSVASWPVLASLPGDGLSHTITNATTVSNMFYSISAQ